MRLLSFFLLLSLLFACGEVLDEEITIAETPNFWEEVTPTLVVKPGLTTAMTDQNWRRFLSTPDKYSNRRVVDFHVLDNGTFILYQMQALPIAFLYSEDFGETWHGVDIKDEDDPSFKPYFKIGGLRVTNDKLRITTGRGGNTFRAIGKGGTFESTDAKKWTKITGEEPFIKRPMGLTHLPSSREDFSGDTQMQQVYDFKEKTTYSREMPKREGEDYPNLVIACDGSEVEYVGAAIYNRFPMSFDEKNWRRTDQFMLQESRLIFDHIFGQNMGPVDEYINGLNNGKIDVDGGESRHSYYVRINGNWIKTNQKLRRMSVTYCIKDRRLYGISDDGRLYRSKEIVPTTCG